MWILGAREEAWLVESIWHLHREAIILLSGIQRENEAFWIVPLGVLGITPFHEFGAIKSDFVLSHQSSLANLLTNLEVSSNHESMLGQYDMERG